MQRLAALRQDFLLALRTLIRQPASAAIAVLTLALGIGVNTAIFSVVNAFMFRPLPVRDGERLLVLATSRSAGGGLGPMSYPDLQAHRDALRDLVDDVAGYSAGFVGLAAETGRPARVLATWVTGNYFELLGIEPAAGRLIRRPEGGAGRVDRIVVLGHATWRRRFAGDPRIVGRTLRLNGQPCTVVGVAPARFHGTFAFSEAEVYLPINWNGAFDHDNRDLRMLHTLARPKAGVTIDRVEAVATATASRLARLHPETNAGVGVRVLPERLARPEENNAGSNRTAGRLILGLVALVLLVAAVNVSGLLLARIASRRRELAVRATLGASPARLLQHLLAESTVLAILGGVTGLVLGVMAAGLLERVRLPGDLPVRFDFQPDFRVATYASLLCLAVVIAIGVMAALSLSRASLDRALRDGAYGAGRSLASHGLRRVLLIGQVAVTMVLTVAAALLARSLWHARSADLGFRPDRVLNAQMDLGQLGYTQARGVAFFAEAERRVRALPGVEDAAFAFSVPLGYVQLTTPVVPEGQQRTATQARVVAGKNVVSSTYFSTLGIRMTSGRVFTTADDDRAPPVTVINRQLAGLLWPGVSPIGRRFREAAPDARWMEVVGVTTTGKYRLLFEDPQPYFYVPIAQQYVDARALHVRTSTSPEALAPAVERAIAAIEPDLPLYDVQSMPHALDGGYGRFLVHAAAVFAAILAGLALLLTSVGLYGMVSHLTRERTQEIGVRVALGATPGRIARLVAGEALRLAVAGGAAGAAAAYACARLLQGFLFGVAPTDALSFVGTLTCLLVVTVAATWSPARRALRVDPVIALRAE